MEYYEARDSVHDQFELPLNPWVTNTPIQNFFAGKHVFITGATGLIGGLLLENILRTCPKVKKVYLLLRAKRGKSVHERLDNIFQNEAFFKVRRTHKNPKEKVQIINGDIVEPMCGISEADKELLRENVNIVFHVAAGLRMDETLRNAYYMNVRATKDLLELSTQMKNLKAFIHVSTAYCIPFLQDVDEKVYQTEYTEKDLKLLTSLGDIELAALTSKIVGKYHNTYAFTKAVAESVVNEYATRVPVAIVRPSVVTGCAKEPLVGWINNIYGTTGISLGVSLGIIRVLYADDNKLGDIIPADKVVTASVAVAWKTGRTQLEKKPQTPVYNIVSSKKAPQTWQELHARSEYSGRTFKIISKKFIRTYGFKTEDNFWIFKIKSLFYHLLFGVIVDQLLKLKGKKPLLVKGYIKIHNVNMLILPFSSIESRFNQSNTDTLWSDMSPLDKIFFNFDMTNFDWNKYSYHNVSANIAYLLKEDFSTLQDDRKRYKRLLKIEAGVKTACCATLAYFIGNYLNYISFIKTI